MPQAANSKTNFMLQQLRQYGIYIRMTKLHKRRKNTNIYIHTYMAKWSTKHKSNLWGKKKDNLSNKYCWKNWISICENTNAFTSLTIYEVKFKIHAKPKIIKLPANTTEHVCDSDLSKNFLDKI